jgi:protein O-GlcNAc transferase
MNRSQLKQQAALALEQGNYPHAIALYEHCLEANPDVRSHAWHLGLAKLLQGQEQEAQNTWFALIAEADLADIADWTAELIAVLDTAGQRLVRQEEWHLALNIYQQILEIDPELLPALQGQALCLAQQGQADEAIALLQPALALNPNDAGTFKVLGIALARQNNFEAAISHYQQALALNPQDADTLRQLGMAYEDLGDFKVAIACYQEALALQPEFPAAYNNLGIVLKLQGKLEDAILCYQKALELDPSFYKAIHNLVALQTQKKTQNLLASVQPASPTVSNQPEFHFNLGRALRVHGDLTGAVVCYRTALEIDPAFYNAHYHLGLCLHQQGLALEAIDNLQRAIKLRPDLPELHNDLGIILSEQYQLQHAVTAFQRALLLKPDFAAAYNNLGLVLRKQGRVEESVQCFQKALDINPELQLAKSNTLLSMLYSSSFMPEDILAAAEHWADSYSIHTRSASHCNPCNPDKQLRIGYVSPDFRRHSVAYFIEPILTHHNPKDFDVFCYAQVSKPDAVTEHLKGLAHHWRSITMMSDTELVAQIQTDSIDILVDLTGHTADERLTAFLHKPAPVQVTYLGYPSTTGIQQIDYRLTDAFADPIDQGNHGYVEELIRLPKCFLCYQPPPDAPDLSPIPALSNGQVTFGSFNNLSKITPDVISLWSKILQTLPTAKLLLKNRSFLDLEVRDRYLQLFANQGIDANRLQFIGYVPQAQHLGFYNNLDISLDTFPYNGTTTTCEALWMGVPVITLAGQSHAGRVGVSLLTAVGLTDLIAENQENYIVKAVELANDWNRLSDLRTTLRELMASSSLCNGSEFVQDLEDTYRQLWQRWCTQPRI